METRTLKIYGRPNYWGLTEDRKFSTFSVFLNGNEFSARKLLLDLIFVKDVDKLKSRVSIEEKGEWGVVMDQEVLL